MSCCAAWGWTRCSGNGRVLCFTGLATSRDGSEIAHRERVTAGADTFPARRFDALFEGTRAYTPWEQFITPREGRFRQRALP